MSKKNRSIGYEPTKPNMAKLRQKLLNCAKHAEAQPNNAIANQTFARVSERAAKYGIKFEG